MSALLCRCHGMDGRCPCDCPATQEDGLCDGCRSPSGSPGDVEWKPYGLACCESPVARHVQAVMVRAIFDLPIFCDCPANREGDA